MTQTLSDEPTRTASTAQRSPFTLALDDCRTLVGRNLKHLLRSPEQWIQTVSLPIILLLLFRYLLGGAIKTDDQTYIDYVVAGLIAISVGFNLTTTVVGVTADLRNGIVERFRSMPVLTTAVLVGHVVVAVLRSAVSATVLIVVGLAVGFRPTTSLAGWLGTIAMLLLFVTAMSWIAVILGITAKTVEGGSGFGMILVFLPYVSSALVPTDTMPGPLRAVVENQPVSPLVDTVRSLLTDTPVGNAAVIAVIWWVPILILAVPVAARMFRRRSAG